MHSCPYMYTPVKYCIVCYTTRRNTWWCNDYKWSMVVAHAAFLRDPPIFVSFLADKSTQSFFFSISAFTHSSESCKALSLLSHPNSCFISSTCFLWDYVIIHVCHVLYLNSSDDVIFGLCASIKMIHLIADQLTVCSCFSSLWNSY